MITSPNAFFTAEEAKQTGAMPVFTFVLHPYYFNIGIAAGSGVFVDCSFIAPDRVEVDYQSSSASWTSPELVGNNEVWPVSVTVSWDYSYTGYSAVAQYRTATTSAILAASSWSTMANGSDYNFYQYYQWRIVFTGIRSFAFDTDSPAEPLAAYAVDAYNPADPWQSYATDGDELIAYIENVSFAGEFTIPPTDIKDAGQFSLEAPEDFSDIVAGDHTLTLINPPADPSNSGREGRYSPGHSNFVFSDENNWYLKNISIYFGYRRSGTEIVDDILLYDGVVVTWGPVQHAIGADGQMQEHAVELYSRNKIGYLLDCDLGVPEADGTPNPVVYGINFMQADQIGSEPYGIPNKSADFESGGTSEFDHTYTNGSGAMSVKSADPISGLYYLNTVISAPGDYAYGTLEQAVYGNQLFFSCRFRVNSYPSSPVTTRIFRIAGNSANFDILIYSHGRVYINAEETDWYIDEYAGSWRTFAIGIFSNIADGVVKIWIDGNEVYSFDGSLSGLTWRDVEVGPGSNFGDIYDIDFDELKLFSTWSPDTYQIAGYPYTSIDTVYIDGSIRVQGKAGGGVLNRIISGRKPNSDTIDLLPQYGIVRFTDADNLPSGDVMVRATKDTVAHPVDVIEAVLGLANSGGYVDNTSFSVAKLSTPDDLISIYAEEMTAGDILREIVRSCLLLCWMDQDVIKLMAYDGTAPSSSVITLDESEIMEISEEISMENIKTKVSGKWGWYDKNKSLYYEATDDELGAKIGDLTEQLDMSWGNVVVTESQLMLKTKVDALLARKSGGVSKLTLLGPLSWARLEIGDNVEIDVPFVRDGEIYTVYGKTLRCQPPYGVELTALKFLGES